MENEKRMVGDYTVLCAVNIGSREDVYKRQDLTSSPLATKLSQGRSDVELGEQVGESKDPVSYTHLSRRRASTSFSSLPVRS